MKICTGPRNYCMCVDVRRATGGGLRLPTCTPAFRFLVLIVWNVPAWSARVRPLGRQTHIVALQGHDGLQLEVADIQLNGRRRNATPPTTTKAVPYETGNWTEEYGTGTTSWTPKWKTTTQMSIAPTSVDVTSSPGAPVISKATACKDWVPEGHAKWHSSLGPATDCDWFAKEDRCLHHGLQNAFFTKTASEACCTCGGGAEEENGKIKSEAGTLTQRVPVWVWSLLCFCCALAA